ncbi:MAG: carboxypeptidase-like regulatory domain-containing protein, partial [Flavobacteriales bacterium]|nr:carboxypeptidase-like regulatory domain-containing protein [Flavobacteriales bacterium]
MKSFNFFVLSAFIFGGMLAGYGQTELKGKVSDFMTFMPIESASVYLQNTTIGSITNADGRFSLRIPAANMKDTLVISSIGYKSYKMVVEEYENGSDIYLEEDVASLDEVVLVADTRPKTGNDIMIRAIERLPQNLPDSAFVQQGFLRHKERNKNEYRWLIEAAVTMYDANAGNAGKKDIKINVDEIRKSYDLRDVDSLFAYTAFLKSKGQNVSKGNIS